MREVPVREEFIDIFKKYVKRDGAAALLRWLEHSDFFEAPASTKYHLCVPGGLSEHSLHVYYRLKELYVAEKCKNEEFDMTDMEEETIAVCALLHDLCKVDFYKKNQRYAKDENGKKSVVTYYTIEDKLPYGHGEKSVYIISSFMKLSRDEALAIRYHMGGWNKDEQNNCSKVFGMNQLAVLLHTADQLATYLDEKD